MNAIDTQLSTQLEDALATIDFARADPEREKERMAAAHRTGISRYEQRIADAKKQAKTDIANLEADRKAEIQRHRDQVAAEAKRHQDEMAILADRLAEVKAKSEKDIAADRRLAASCHAALDELVRE